MWCGIVSLFPEKCRVLADWGMTERAIAKNLLNLEFWDPRKFTTDKHCTVDDRPYGGGPGMVMKVEPLREAVHAAKQRATHHQGKTAKVICLSPQGKCINQRDIRQLAVDRDPVVFVAGRYEGIDERFYALDVDEEWSIGDYILSGGELAIMVVIDALVRLLPGVLGHEDSAKQDSFGGDGLLDFPHYTRPSEIGGLQVPEVLLSGDHNAIAKWRLQQQLIRTQQRRPDLLKKRKLNKTECQLLNTHIQEGSDSHGL